MNEKPEWQIVFEPDARIVGLVQYRDFLVMATERRVYQSAVDSTGRISFHEVILREQK